MSPAACNGMPAAADLAEKGMTAFRALSRRKAKGNQTTADRAEAEAKQKEEEEEEESKTGWTDATKHTQNARWRLAVPFWLFGRGEGSLVPWALYLRW